MATNATKASALFHEVAGAFRVVLWEEPGEVNFRRVFEVRQAIVAEVARANPQELVFLMDAYDVMWLGCDRDLGATFAQRNVGVFISAEFGSYPLWPPAPLPPQFAQAKAALVPNRCSRAHNFCPVADHLRFPNSGFFGGFAGVV